MMDDATKERYLGSVLFFKHVILAVVILLILIPTVLSIYLWAQNFKLHNQISEIQEALNMPEQSNEEFMQNLSAAVPASSQVALPEAPSYTQLYPELYAPEAERGTEDLDNSVYLTFDDGPSARTDEILKILDEYGIKATFFVVGSSNEEGLARLRAIAEAGHTLAIHSYSHDYNKIYASVEAYLEDFNKLYCQIVDATGIKPQIFRFPGGSINSYNSNVYREIIAEMTRRGFVFFDWNVANGDAASSKLQSSKVLAGNALRGTGARRAIILMHDSAAKTTTVGALPAIIEGYKAAGFTFLPLTAETRSITFGYYS